MAIFNIGNIVANGRNITIANNKVYIDGELQDTGNQKEITIIVYGNIETLEVDCCNKIEINGNCNSAKSSSGNIYIKESVNEDVSTSSGDVEVNGNVGRNISTSSGDVKCKNVFGKITTMSGDITHE